MFRSKRRLLFSFFFFFWIIYFFVFYSRLFSFGIDSNLIASHLNVWGDWAIHLTMGSAMAFREGWLAESPLLIHTSFRYPFLVNFISAFLLKLGFPFFSAFSFPSFILSIFSISVLLIVPKKIFNSTRISIIGSFLFIFNGGWGFVHYLKDVLISSRPFQSFFFPAHSYTLSESQHIRLGSVLDTMLIPQRSFQLGFPVALLILSFLYSFWFSNGNEAGRSLHRRRAIVLGLVTGIMPFIHIHSFLVVLFIAFICFLEEIFRVKSFRSGRILFWSIFFITALAVSIPSVFSLGLLKGDTARGFKWFPGWYAREWSINWIRFFFLNWGIAPLVAMAGGFLWFINRKEFCLRGTQVVFFILPFVLIFVSSNLFSFHPWIWDNTKFFVWSSLGFSILSAYFLVMFATSRLKKILACLLFIVMTFSGALDAYRIMIPSLNTYQMYTNEELAMADWVRQNTSAQSVWLTGPYHNNWLFNLTGRKVIMAYEGWLWTHGYKYGREKSELMTMLRSPDRDDLFKKYKVDFVAIGSVEQKKWGAQLDEFLKTFPVVKRTRNITIFSTSNENPFIQKEKPAAPGTRFTSIQENRVERHYDPGLIYQSFKNENFYGKVKPILQKEEVKFFYEANQVRSFQAPCSMSWQGIIRVPETGSYTFKLASDDGSWMYIGDQLVIDNGGDHEVQEKENTVVLEKGFHSFELKYFDSGGGAVFNPRWIPPGGVEQALRGDFFFHDIRWKPKRQRMMFFE